MNCTISIKSYLLLFLPLLCGLYTHAQDSGDLSTPCNFEIQAALDHPSCFGSADGAIQLNVTNAPSDALQFNWTNTPTPSTSNEAGNLPAGIYTVIVSESDCADTLSLSLTNPPPIDAPLLDTTLCGGGSINLLQGVSGGTGVYSFSATTLAGTPVNCTTCPSPTVQINELTFIVLDITDSNGCTATRYVIVDVLNPLSLSLETTDETCNGNGTITVNASGGSGDYLYSLGDGAFQNSNVFAGLTGALTYQVQVLDLAGCSAMASAIVDYAPDFTVPVLDPTPVSCNGANDGQIAVSVAGDGTDIFFAIDTPTDIAPVVDQVVFDELTPGPHTVFVIENDGNCINGYTEVISEPEPLTIDSSSVTGATCPDGDDGQIELFVSGGNGGYQYLLDGTDQAVDSLITGLGPGEYTITILDSLGCEQDTVLMIEDSEPPDLGAQTTPSCPEDNTGAIVIVEAGKLLIGDFLFSLDSMNWQTENGFEGLPPGDYTVYVQYPDGCVFTVAVTIPTASAPDLQLTLQHVSCPEGDNGSVTAEVTSGGSTQAYEYSLDTLNFVPQNKFKDLPADTYTLYLLDDLSCIFEYPFAIEEPDAPAISLEGQHITCHGESDGAIEVTVEDGGGPYEYSLNGMSFQEEPLFSGIPAGQQFILVRDSLNCLFIDSLFLQEPTPIAPNFTILDETCGDENGVLLSLPSGGTPPYTFLWSTGDTIAAITGLVSGNYFLSITDDAGCQRQEDAFVDNQPGPILVAETTHAGCYGAASGAIDLTVLNGTAPFQYVWSNGQYTEDIYGLAAGSYVVTVYDSQQCTSTRSYTVHQPPPLELSYQSGPSGEEHWFINLIVEGGAQPYTYLWSNGETTQDVFGLLPGVYRVIVTDDQGCSREQEISVGVTGTEKSPVLFDLKLFPNPASKYLNVFLKDTNLPQRNDARLRMVDTQGRILRNYSAGRLDEVTHIIPVEGLPGGVYFLQYLEEGRTLGTERFVKE